MEFRQRLSFSNGRNAFRRIFLATSFLLALLFASFWIHSNFSWDALELIFPAGGRLELATSSRLNITFQTSWPEKSGIHVNSRSLSNLSDMSGMPYGSLQNAMGGQIHYQGWGLWGFGFVHGYLYTVLNADGTAFRMKPGGAFPTFRTNRLSGPIPTFAFLFPLWLPTVLFAIPPLFFPLYRLRSWLGRSRSLTQSICLSCGYDLRATAERCPECGTPVPTPEAIAAAAQFRHRVATATENAVKPSVAVGLLSCYAAAALVAIGLLENPPKLQPMIADVAAVLIILLGAFHAAAYRRWRGVFLRYGFLTGAAAMILPSLLSLRDLSRGDSEMYYQALLSWTPLIIALGFGCWLSATARWRLIDRKLAHQSRAAPPPVSAATRASPSP